ncbi:hypothetical protein ACOME3_007799 [Neoechinorhynchus agilis]
MNTAFLLLLAVIITVKSSNYFTLGPDDEDDPLRYQTNDNPCLTHYQSAASLEYSDGEVDCECHDEGTNEGFYDLSCYRLYNFTNKFRYDLLQVDRRYHHILTNSDNIAPALFSKMLIRKLKLSNLLNPTVHRDSFVQIIDEFNSYSLHLDSISEKLLCPDKNQLHELFLDTCELTTFPRVQLNRGSELMQLGVGNNIIDQVGIENILGLPNLQQLDLRNNSLGKRKLDFNLFKAHVSHSLLLSSVEMRSSDIGETLPSMKILYLYNNQIARLEDQSFCFLNRVKRSFPLELHLELNPIQEVSQCAFYVPEIGQLRSVINTEDITCGCGIWIASTKNMVSARLTNLKCVQRNPGYTTGHIAVIREHESDICGNSSDVDCIDVCEYSSNHEHGSHSVNYSTQETRSRSSVLHGYKIAISLTVFAIIVNA